MKALSTPILIVVTAVVIIVAALVVLTLFGGGMGNVANIATFKNNCLIQCSQTCKIGTMPPSWYALVNVGNTQTSCAREFSNYDCSSSGCGGTTGTVDCGTYPNCKSPCVPCQYPGGLTACKTQC